ncbi:MAG: AmmeMemoRadiSam system radical SAM enzyme [Spirochaetales bacterium]|jgi:pyruvate formate lyase activating enzyme|nr:AmmeMemoRadiSam system radical SAM enzyme [Spirochaetales bacterium]
MKTTLKCTICPKGCELTPGEIGDCRVRTNTDGIIRCITYAQPCALNIDPIEKKPLFHFLPGSPILSIATAGCNLHCKQCQNHSISQSSEVYSASPKLMPNELSARAKEKGAPSIAYTYTEPLVSYEYTYDCCKAAAQAGIKNVLVTAAYINPDPLRALCRYVDAANVDLKSFSEDFYRNICGAHLQPVLNALKVMKASGVFLEITNIIIPTLNDSLEKTEQLCDWIVENLGDETPVHFSRFFPQNQLKHLPPTPSETLLFARETALKVGLKFIYIGNIENREGENTRCPMCLKLLIERKGYRVIKNCIEQGKCPGCATPIPGIWK